MGVKKTIARNMMNSLQTMAQNTCTLEVDCTDLLALREKYVADQEMLGCKITVNDLLCKMLGKWWPRPPGQRHLRRQDPLTPTSMFTCPWPWPPRTA